VTREQSKSLISEHETADVDDSRRAGYRCLSPPRIARRLEAVFSALFSAYLRAKPYRV